MNIAITNEAYLTPQHIYGLKKIGNVAIFEGTTNENIIERLSDADIAMIDCFVTPITEELITKLPSLKYVTINSTGHDLVDSAAIQKHNVVVSNVPSFSTEAVAELAIGLIFAVNRKITTSDRVFRENPFEVDPGSKEETLFEGYNLKNKTLGIVGLGEIGTRVADIGRCLGMNVIAYNRTPKNHDGIEMKTLAKVICESDILSLHLALTSDTANLITSDNIATMKKSAIIINTARGDIIDSEALASALTDGKIRGAGLDTVSPCNKENPILSAPNIVFTPHNAYNTYESRQNMADTVVENIKSFIQGKFINTI